MSYYSHGFIEKLKACDGKTVDEIRKELNYTKSDQALRSLINRHNVKYLRYPKTERQFVEKFKRLAPTMTYEQIAAAMNITVKQAYYYAERYDAFCISVRNGKHHLRDWSFKTISEENVKLLKSYQGRTLRMIKAGTEYPHNIEQLSQLLRKLKIWYSYANSINRHSIVSEDDLETLRKVGEHMTTEQMCRMLGITDQQVRNLCARNGIKPRKKLEKRHLEIVNTYRIMKSVEKTAEYHGCSQTTVYNVINKMCL